MAETKPKNKTVHSSSLRWYIGIFIGVILIFIIGAGFGIWQLNKQFDKNNSPISNSKQTTNPLTNLQTDSTKVYKIKEEDLKKFNDHIDYLKDKVEEEVKRTQENNQYDIDRINTFLAIGIGLLAIIGGLLPIFVNFFSKEHLEKRMKEFEEDSKAIAASATKAKEDAEKANSSIQGIDEKVKQLGRDLDPMKSEVENVKEATKKIPTIDLLVLQNAVAKFTSTDAMKLNTGSERLEWIAAYLENLNSALENFDDGIIHSFEIYTKEDLKYFKSCISELKVALFTGPIRWIVKRESQHKIDEAVLQLGKFEKMETKYFKGQLKTVSVTITELKTLVEIKTTV